MLEDNANCMMSTYKKSFNLNRKYKNHDDEFELGNQTDDAVLWNFPVTTVNEVLLFDKKLQDKTFRFKIQFVQFGEENQIIWVGFCRVK
ncbi:hypothetical protein QTP88_013519 [Uroleucon formosanum]